MAKPQLNYSVIKVKDKRYITLYFKNNHFRTGFKVDSENDFDQKNQRFSLQWRKENQGAEKSILNMKLKVDNLIKMARELAINELAYIKQQLNNDSEDFKKTKIAQNQKPSTVFKEYINSVIDKEIKKENTKQRFVTHFNKIKWFEETNDTTLGCVDIDYIYSFIRWMAKEKTYIQVVKNDKAWGRSFTAEKKVRNSNATIKRWLSDFNSFLIWCTKNNKNLIFPHERITKLSSSLKTASDSQEIIALSKLQWEAFKNFKLPPNIKGLQSSYDGFIFSCCCGLRASDFSSLYQAHVTDRTITMLASKTGYKFSVKMNDIAYSIYLKYNKDFRGKFPSVQRLSINLRKILKELPEFQTDDVKYEYILENINKIPVKTYEKFTFHSSRRTFVTNCMRNNATIAQVQKFTGWTDIRQLKNYLDYVQADDNEDAVLNF